MTTMMALMDSQQSNRVQFYLSVDDDYDGIGEDENSHQA